ncbi:hypothetical protein [Xenorhabdus sp. KJ12.1]|uniref:hypothetical protein n=1 Tax=Xenorhabdus sp. KJ12.1 TaxID=1851571 RepID=UPI000C049D04|nr:hypothetical protein [Xenorhabdus sp. KJ12.1]PHM72183.1 hypothetical protein Xekj_00461 [Xenorhabdus sp. KJ12.1]
MSETKMYFLSAGVSVVCSALLLIAFYYAGKSQQIKALEEQANNSVYLRNQDEINKEMVTIMLPLLQKQHEEEAKRSKIKKPDTVYTPEQLQSSRGY